MGQGHTNESKGKGQVDAHPVVGICNLNADPAGLPLDLPLVAQGIQELFACWAPLSYPSQPSQESCGVHRPSDATPQGKSAHPKQHRRQQR